MNQLEFTVRPLSEVLGPTDLSGQGRLVEQVYELLRRSIIDLSLPPESALVEQDVASALSVSKTPVREAIIRLSREGLVQVAPKRGSFVTAISLEKYFEACFTRVQLETGCVRRLATRGVSMADETRFKSLLAEQKEALREKDATRFFELDEQLHRTMFDIAGLPGVWQVMNVAKAEMDRVRHLKRAFGNRQHQAVVDEHTAIVAAIIDRDPARAEQALLSNIGAVDDEINSISDNPQLLRTIDDLNQVVMASRRSRGSRKTAGE